MTADTIFAGMGATIGALTALIGVARWYAKSEVDKAKQSLTIESHNTQIAKVQQTLDSLVAQTTEGNAIRTEEIQALREGQSADRLFLPKR